jgi:hypothetical protein
MLRDAWHDALILKDSREAWRELRSPLAKYHNLPRLLWTWYRDHTLAGCRRLLDDRKQSSSAVRALREIQKDAPTLTFEVLCQGFAGDASEHYLRQSKREALDKLCPGSDHITRGAVHSAIGKLKADHDRVVDLASETVANRNAGGPKNSAGEEDINALLDDVLEVVHDWTALLDSVSLSIDPPGVTGVRPAAKALSLFDWQDFIKARARATRLVGPTRSPDVYRAIEESARFEYAFTVPEQLRNPRWSDHEY